MRVCLIRPAFDSSSVHYSGGAHGLRCVAETLAAAGHDVHLLYCAVKAELMYTVMLNGAMSQLAYSSVEGVAVWNGSNITHHVSLLDASHSVTNQLSAAFDSLGLAASAKSQAPTLPFGLQRLVDECASLERCSTHIQQQQQQCWFILDADGSQGSAAAGAASLFAACVHHLNHKRLLLFVQNIHFLSLGPFGAAGHTPGVLAAWGTVGGVMCVSHFVAQYVAQHARSFGLDEGRIRVVNYATWQTFGQGPFANVGQQMVQRLPWPQHSFSSSASAPPAALHSMSGSRRDQDQQQQQYQNTPVIGCLKLTPEKGGQLFLAVAQQLPQLQFLAVCTNPSLMQQAASISNVQLVQPAADVDSVLQHVTILLAPSLWQEAFGMVVMDALLRGIPVVVSNQGGLSEAACGVAAAVVPVNPMQLPVNPASGCPEWRHRQFPAEQPVQQWASAIWQLLSSCERYQQCSEAGRAAALQLVQQQPQLLQEFEGWLRGLAS